MFLPSKQPSHDNVTDTLDAAKRAEVEDGISRRKFGATLGMLAIAASIKTAKALPSGLSFFVSGLTGERIAEPMADEPALQFSATSDYDSIWWGSKMHSCTASVRVWRPRAPKGFFILGDTAVYGSDRPNGSAILVREANPVQKNPILKAPRPDGWNQIWNDSDTGGSQDGSIWQPAPPDGYIAIGTVAADGYNQPSVPTYMCVRFDQCAASPATDKIWGDRCSHHDGDTAFWRIAGLPNGFVAGTSHDSYGGTAYKPLRLSL